MPTNIRLTKSEQTMLRNKSIEINKVLIMSGHIPLQESEIIHWLLEECINKLKAGNSGELKIID